MIFLKSFLYSLNYLLFIIDNFSKPFYFITSTINLNFNYLNFFNNNINLNNNFYLQQYNLFLNIVYYNNLFFKQNIINNKYGIFIFYFIFYSILGLIFFVFLQNFFNKIKNKINNTFFIVQKFSKESDQEIMSFEDILIFVIFFVSFFINVFNLISIKELITFNYYITLWFLFIYFFSLIIFVPLNILFSAGSNFILYLKGVAKLNTLIGYLIEDFITVLAFFLRFFLQIIRWCLFLTTYYLLHEFVFEWLYDVVINNYFFFYINNFIFIKLNNNIIIQLILHFLRFCFELFDTCLILLIQITAFIAVILWLFNFLFSLSLEDVFEKKN